MVTFVVRLADLEFLSPHDLSGGLSTAGIIDVIRKQFDYLPGVVQVEISDGVATIRFEEASAHAQAEAQRLLEKATKRARSGEFENAKDIYERVLELDPTVPNARRDLAMALYELGETFSGLQLMCLMHAGFKRIAPEHDTGMDLEEPFLTALQMYQSKGEQH